MRSAWPYRIDGVQDRLSRSWCAKRGIGAMVGNRADRVADRQEDGERER
jgi:hypothetical protein